MIPVTVRSPGLHYFLPISFWREGLLLDLSLIFPGLPTPSALFAFPGSFAGCYHPLLFRFVRNDNLKLTAVHNDFNYYSERKLEALYEYAGMNGYVENWSP